MKHATITQKFWIGIAISLVGAALLWVGDGGESLLGKGIVASGVILVIVGLGILRYLLFANKSKMGDNR